MKALLVAFAAGLCLTLPSATLAQSRPDEDSMFGAETPPSDAGTPDVPSAAKEEPALKLNPEAATVPPNPGASRDAEALSSGDADNAFQSGRVKENPLSIGGQFYERLYGQYGLHQKLKDTRMSAPTLVDLYLDARPTDNIRAQVLGRMQFDPFYNATGLGLPSSASSSTTTTTTTVASNPSVGLDQAWLAFNVANRVFVTAGRQHVKWGTAHFFSPNDFLSSQYRDPLAQFDTRLGVTMVKASVPWEAKGWNFYAVALFEPTQLAATNLGTAGSSGSDVLTGINQQQTHNGTTFGDIGGAARAEFTFGNTTVGFDGLAQKNRRSRAGLDVTSSLGPLDVYAEGAIRDGPDQPLWEPVENPNPAYGILGRYQTYGTKKPPIGVAAGLTADIALPNNRSLNIGGEYFYNSAGYTDPKIYPWLIFQGEFNPFYTGVHYAAVSLTLADNEAHATYVLSNVGNLSDGSFILRGDYVITLMSYLQLEAFADVHYGNKGGEFRLSVDVDPADVPGVNIGAGGIHVPAPVVDVGLALRVSL